MRQSSTERLSGELARTELAQRHALVETLNATGIEAGVPLVVKQIVPATEKGGLPPVVVLHHCGSSFARMDDGATDLCTPAQSGWLSERAGISFPELPPVCGVSLVLIVSVVVARKNRICFSKPLLVQSLSLGDGFGSKIEAKGALELIERRFEQDPYALVRTRGELRICRQSVEFQGEIYFLPEEFAPANELVYQAA